MNVKKVKSYLNGEKGELALTAEDIAKGVYIGANANRRIYTKSDTRRCCI